MVKKSKAEDEFYKNLNATTTDKFLIELGNKTNEAWKLIVQLAIKKHMDADTHKADSVKIFCSTVDLSMAIIGTFKEHLQARAKHLDKMIMEKYGVKVGFSQAVDKCIKITTPDEMVKQMNKMKNTPSYMV